MRAGGVSKVGRFSVDLEVANNDDLVLARRGVIPSDEVRRETIRGVVDSGAVKLVLPEAVVKRLGLQPGNPINVKYADGRRAAASRPTGSSSSSSAATGLSRPSASRSETALIGAIVLEELDLLVDCTQQKLVPRDPSGPLYEIE